MAGDRAMIAGLIAAVLVGTSLAAVAEETRSGSVTVLRGNPVTEDGTVIGVGNGGTEAPPADAGKPLDQTGAVNGVRTGSSNAGGEIANPPPGPTR